MCALWTEAAVLAVRCGSLMWNVRIYARRVYDRVLPALPSRSLARALVYRLGSNCRESESGGEMVISFA